MRFHILFVLQAMFNQVHSPPPESPSSSSVRMIESKETATDVQGKLSPVSVLEPLLTDDESSPTTSTRFFSSGMYALNKNLHNQLVSYFFFSS